MQEVKPLLDVHHAKSEEMWTDVLQLVLFTSMMIWEDDTEAVDEWAEEDYGVPSRPPHPGFGLEIRTIALEMLNTWETKVDMVAMGLVENPEYSQANQNS